MQINLFAARTEFYSKGLSNETTKLNTNVETDFLLHYMQIQVLFQYLNDQVLNKSGYLFFFNAGPYAAFPLNTQICVSDNNADGTLVPVSDSKNTDWGTTFGIGFQTPFFNKDICFDLRFDTGLSKI